MSHSIKVTACLENCFWVAIFERIDGGGIAAARVIFGKEPTDPELYEYVQTHFQELRFTEPVKFKLIIKRKNSKRVQREVRREMEKAKTCLPSTTHAQDILRLELEKNKKVRKILSKTEKEAMAEEAFALKQQKKKRSYGDIRFSSRLIPLTKYL